MTENFKKNILERAGKGSETGVLRFYTLGILLQTERPITLANIKEMIEQKGKSVSIHTLGRIMAEIEALHPLMELQTITQRNHHPKRKPTQHYQLKFK